MEILEPKPPGTFWATQGLLWDCFTSTAQMYVRGQIHLPAALLGTSLTKGGVVPTAVLYTVLPWPVAVLSCPGQSPYCLALASRHTVLPWPVAILSCPGQSPYSRPNHRAAYCLTKDKRLTCDSATVGVGIHQRTAGKCGTQWCGRLRHCATSRKVAGSIPDGVIEVIH